MSRPTAGDTKQTDPLRESWRAAAVKAWYDSQDHVGQADTDPEPYVAAAADAAAQVVLEYVWHTVKALREGGDLDG